MKIYSKSNFKIMVSYICALIFISTSCYQDVIDIDLSEIDKQIVIEGIVTDQPGSCKVVLSRTSNLYHGGSVLRISDAVVIISDNLGNTDTLYETLSGTYRTNSLQGVPGRTYTLQVQVEGIIYSADSQMPVPIELDSISFEERGNYPHWYNLSCYFLDHAGVEDYCRIKLYRNQEYLDAEKILYHDKYTDGEAVVIDDIDTDFFANDFVEIEFFTIDREVYDYYSGLFNFEDDSDEQTILDLVSANPNSNISNNALGYFSAQTVRYYSALIR